MRSSDCWRRLRSGVLPSANGRRRRQMSVKDRVARTVIYARSKIADDRAISDQIALCTMYAESAGLAVTRTFADWHERWSYDCLWDAMEKGEVAVVLMMDMSRLGRSLKRWRAFLEHASKNHVRIVSVLEGFDSTDAPEGMLEGRLKMLENLRREILFDADQRVGRQHRRDT
ncbi:MAG: recombinase family protein [Proteobacteria bacterium]|nr:recombinase family protein [Pseudomonadota bacterium]